MSELLVIGGVLIVLGALALAGYVFRECRLGLANAMNDNERALAAALNVIRGTAERDEELLHQFSVQAMSISETYREFAIHSHDDARVSETRQPERREIIDDRPADLGVGVDIGG